MNKRIMLVLFVIILVVALSGCSPMSIQDSNVSSSSSSESSEVASDPVDSACKTGVTLTSVAIDQNGVVAPDHITAYIVRPNAGCNLPTLYCMFAQNRNVYDNGGPSCVEISDLME